MADPQHLTRRAVLGGVSTAALWPALGQAQSAPTMVDFAARARALSGFNPIPRALLAELRAVLNPMEQSTLVAGGAAAADLEKSVLKALYTGIYTPDAPDAAPTRLAYAQALMFAAIEEAVNVPSYCGGTPAYWAQKPQAA